MSKSLPYSKTRKTFRTLFILSTSLFLILFMVLRYYYSDLPLLAPGPGEEPSLIEQAVTWGGIVTVLGSCMTSIVSAIGFISALILGWRKETRDTKTSELERKRLEIELKKQRLELNKLKSEVERKRKSDK